MHGLIFEKIILTTGRFNQIAIFVKKKKKKKKKIKKKKKKKKKKKDK